MKMITKRVVMMHTRSMMMKKIMVAVMGRAATRCLPQALKQDDYYGHFRHTLRSSQSPCTGDKRFYRTQRK